MAKNFNPELVRLIKSFLDNDDWHYTFEEKDGVFRFGLNLSGMMKSVQYLITVSAKDYTCYATAPLSVDSDDEVQMQRMAEFFSRANYGLKQGNFELDFRDGEMRYKCYVDCEGADPSVDIIKNSIYCPASMFKTYSKGILNILFNDMGAKEAVEMCEN